MRDKGFTYKMDFENKCDKVVDFKENGSINIGHVKQKVEIVNGIQLIGDSSEGTSVFLSVILKEK